MYATIYYPTPENCRIPPMYRPVLTVPIVARCIVPESQMRFIPLLQNARKAAEMSMDRFEEMISYSLNSEERMLFVETYTAVIANAVRQGIASQPIKIALTGTGQ